MENCIFCKIVSGEIKSWTVYEDNENKAFLDINPASEGHTIIIPKKHYNNLYDIPEKNLKSIICLAKKIAKSYKTSLGINEVNIMHASGINAQQSVPHFHMHIVPRKKDDGLNLWYKTDKKVLQNFDNLLEKLRLSR
jgi:histidine triad (HIT) family protein